MTLHLADNPYKGINAHANSWLQNTQGLWSSFHTLHLTYLTVALNGALPVGYEALCELSLQVQQYAADDELQPTGRARRPQPDVTVFSYAEPQPAGAVAALEEIDTEDVTEDVFPIYETLDLVGAEALVAVIYKIEPNSALGRPVVRIELLSPTNKPSGDGYAQYRDKRTAALLGALPLVEVDYLHQQAPVYKSTIAPIYPKAPKSFAYSIAVSDPRPSIHEGKLWLYRFGVDKPIPRFDIPLDGENKLIGFDLSPVYNQTLDSLPVVRRVVDYAELPSRFETYSAIDQQRIRERMRVLVAVP